MNPALKPVVVIGSIFLLVMGIAGISEYRAAHAKELIPWRKDLPAAITDAAKTNQRIFIDFTATWCGPCQKMKTSTFSDPDVKAATDKFIPVQIDIDAQSAIAQKYEISSIPTFIILSSNGEVLNRKSGYLNSEQLINWLAK